MEKLKSRTGLISNAPNNKLPTADEHLKSITPNKDPGLFSMDNLGKASPYISMAGSLGSAAIDSGNTSNNLEFGGQSESAKGIKSAVGSAIPIFDAANAVGGFIGSGLNKGNRYNEFGYNEREKYGEAYMQAGGLFDPAGMAIRSLEEGGEGSGARALLSLTGLGGSVQYDYEQKQALEREKEAEMEENSEWQMNQFNFRPNLDV